MRVAIFCEYYYPFISGVVTHIETLCRGLEDAGHEVLIVTLDPKTRRHYIKGNVLYAPAVSVKKLYGYGVRFPIDPTALKYIRKFNPDIIHIHTEFTMGLFGLYCADKIEVPVVYTLHTMYDDYLFYVFPKKMESAAKMARPFARAYIKKVASRATEVIGPSVKVVEYLHRCGVKRHINIVLNTVDVSHFLAADIDKGKVHEIQKKLGIQEGDVCLCFVGRVGKEKSIDVLVNYFADCFKDKPAFKLFIIGDGPEKSDIQNLIDSRKVSSQVKLLGRIEHDELPCYYHAFDLFATASVTEMNSISQLEATASGLYIVQRLDIYNRDLIKSGINGDVFSTMAEFGRIVQEYADLSLTDRKKKKERVSAYARRYGPQEFTEAILNVYARAIDKFVNSKY